MLKTRRVLWGEGMFLRPQHFQQQALQHEAALAGSLQGLYRHAWGARAVVVDETGLAAGVLRFDNLSIWFRDGTRYCAPEHDPLPPSRDLAGISADGNTVLVYACVPELHPHGGNVGDHERNPAQRVRFLKRHAASCDLYSGALEAELTLLDLNVQLRLEDENRDGFESLPVARLRRDGQGQWSVDASYLPPSLDLALDGAAARLLRRLLDILQVKSGLLAARQREHATHLLEYGSSDIAAFWLLHTVNRNYARLQHLERARPLHPEALYLALAELYGELVTFSRSHTLADLPPYRHEDLAGSLTPLDDRIRDLLDTVVSNRHQVITLRNPKPSFHIGHLDNERLLEADFYLSVQSSMPAAAVIDAVPSKLKIGAPDDVEKILNSAVRGVAVVHATQTPSSVPVRIGNHYFALEPNSEVFQRMVQARSVCVYVPQTLADLKLELIAVFR
ncbi:hypothetical protein dqs_1419 [Azoarcus olearius]|uniref:type VI secretion system baseplate subunit TssK n=1 Tax=Azoarcus sp. (strain BH72) TaxID=418699 RepID=UPI00080618C9|nr:type VI secretion system baseplate subunit TssK [Azoarcus olearius]ANQ84467.1 hypothetical protein dqs_1419 [Azoarcus olearius]